jgi:hypothetical protein
MKTALRILVALVIVLIGCSDDDPGLENPSVEETISVPVTPTGSDHAYVGLDETYVSGGSVSSEGHALEYRFDFDADGNSDQVAWGATTSAIKTWSSSDTYVVKAQARCSIHTDKVSPWSDGKTVTVTFPVSTPWTPTGTTSLNDDVGYDGTYMVGGSTSWGWGTIEYRLDFNAEGVGDTTGWQESNPIIGDMARWRKHWPNPGVFVVKGQARSASNPERLSAWSDGLRVIVWPPSVSKIVEPD